MLITAETIRVLQEVPGSGMIRCSGCHELYIGECTGGSYELDDESPKIVGVHRSFGPCPNCGQENTTFE